MGGRSKLSRLEERLAEVRRTTVEGFADRARELREAAERLVAGEAEARGEIRRMAHRLRGVAGSAGHAELSERAGRLEAAAETASDPALLEGARRLAAAAERASASRDAAPEPLAPPPAESAPLDLRVVALDDEPATRRLLEITLLQVGRAQAAVLADPAAVMERVRSGEIDLLIVDAMMPEVSGLELYRAARRERGPSFPIVILSAASPEELGWQLPDDPRLTWMRKPFRPAALLAELRAFAGR
ncbi:MAG: response regulator [Sandaracinaceae bacterium]|nr:response regulator [Sandaracinaceae bacterium]